MIRLNSIKAKLSVIMLIIVAVSLCTLGGINYWNAQKVVLQDSEDSLKILAADNSEKLGFWLNTRKSEVAVLANSPILSNGTPESIVAYLKGEIKRNPVYMRFLVADMAGTTYYTDGSKASLVDRLYFQQARTGKSVISDPVVSKVDGKLVIVAATPIIRNGTIVGVLGGTVTMDDLMKIVLSIKVGESGYAYVTQSDGLTIIHPEKDTVMKTNWLKDTGIDPTLSAATEKLIKGEKGLTQYTYGGVEKYVSYAPIPETTWGLSVNAPVKEVNSKLQSLMWISAMLTLVVLVIVAIITRIFAQRIAAPIQKLHAFANRIAQGDLSETDAHVHSDDEIGELAKSFKVMAENLQSLIRHVTNSADKVSHSANALTANSEQSAQAVNQVAGAISDVAHGAELQLNAVNRASDVIQNMVTNIQQVAGNANEVAKKSSLTSTMASDGSSSVDKAVRQMAKIEKIVGVLAEVVAKLGNSSKEIGQIVNTIAGIAGQTNLLALNAAIEAARAGEQGRGFAVVAEEVRKLAEQSEESAKQIADLISVIQNDTDKAVVAMNEGTNEVKLGAEVVDTAGKAFQEITGQIEQVSDQVKVISTAIQQMVSGSQQIVSSVQEIDELSKKAAGEAQTVSAATEEQSASMEEIAASSQDLAKMAQELQGAVSQFRIR